MLESLEALWFAEYLRRSVFAYPVVSTLHILCIGGLMTSAILMDLRILGFGRHISVDGVIASLRPISVLALAGAVITGLLLFSVQPQNYVGNPVFLAKLLLIILATTNAAIFTMRAQHAYDTPLTRAMVALSLMLWLGALTAGRMIAFFD